MCIHIYIYICIYIHIHIRLLHEMGPERRVTLLLHPLVPSPPPGTSFWVLSLRLKLPQERPRMVPKTRSCPDSFSYGFEPLLQEIFGAQIAPKSVQDSYLFQISFQSRLLLPKPRAIRLGITLTTSSWAVRLKGAFTSSQAGLCFFLNYEFVHASPTQNGRSVIQFHCKFHFLWPNG